MVKYGSLVKRLRRRPLTAETGVRFPYELLTVLILRTKEPQGCMANLEVFWNNDIIGI